MPGRPTKADLVGAACRFIRPLTEDVDKPVTGVGGIPCAFLRRGNAPPALPSLLRDFFPAMDSFSDGLQDLLPHPRRLIGTDIRGFLPGFMAKNYNDGRFASHHGQMEQEGITSAPRGSAEMAAGGSRRKNFCAIRPHTHTPSDVQGNAQIAARQEAAAFASADRYQAGDFFTRVGPWRAAAAAKKRVGTRHKAGFGDLAGPRSTTTATCRVEPGTDRMPPTAGGRKWARAIKTSHKR